MKQILHIFQKDSRQHWPEIALSLGITAVLMWLGPYQWRVSVYDGNYSTQLVRELAMLMSPLMVIGWVILIARVVHAEPLVGDRQFWITRPYEWQKLLAAKALFVAVWVCVPLVLMQIVLLARAGFAPAHWIAGLAYNLLLVLAVMILPLAAIAAVTTGFGRVALTLVGALFGLVVLGVVESLLRARFSPNANPDRMIGTLTIFALLFAVCAAVMVVQYSARKTRTSVMLLVGLAVSGIAIYLVGPDQWLIDRMYSQGGTAPVLLTLDRAKAGHSAPETWLNANDLIGIEVPLKVSGVADGYAALFDDVKFTVQAANGVHWTSGWQHLDHPPAPGANGSDASGDAQIPIAMPNTVYDELKGIPFQIQMRLATTEAKIVRVTEISGSVGESAVPGVGYCDAEGLPNSNRWTSERYFSCWSALRAPFTRMSMLETYQACPSEHGAVVAPVKKLVWSAWAGSSDAIPTDFFLVPVATRSQTIGSGFPNENGVAMCPVAGSIVFTQFEPVRRTQVSLTVADFRLEPKP